MKVPPSRITKSLPLQIVLIVPFLLQIFGAVSLVGYLSFRNGQRAVNDLAKQVMDRTGDVVEEHLKSYLAVPQKLSQLNADVIRRGLLDVGDRQAMGQYFWDQMQAYDLTYIGVGLTNGEGAGAARYDGKTITIDDWTAAASENTYTYATDDDGNRTRVLERWEWDNFSEDWYTKPIEAKRPIWQVFSAVFPSGPHLTASAGRPIYDAQNTLLGMVAAEIHLLKLSDFLQDLSVSRSGQVFIMERDGTLIASSSDAPFFTVENDDIQRLPAIASPDPIIQDIAKQLQADTQLASTTEPRHFQFDVQGEKHFIDIQPWQDEYGLDWLLVISVPENTFMGTINANTRTTIALCFGALVVSSVLGIFTSRWIVQPILRLNRASQEMAAGHLDQTVSTSGIKELDTLSNSFNYMVVQLHDSFAVLEKNKEELEDRVAERTAELKNTLTELQRTQSQVVQSEKMSSLGQLVAGVAHEINNPVNFIHGNISHIDTYTQDLLRIVQAYESHYPDPPEAIQEIIEEVELDFLTEDLVKLLQSMRVGTDRIRQIVLSLRNFSRLDEADFKEVDVHDGIDSTILILQHRLKAKPDSPAIEVIKDYAKLPLVECYPGQLNQVFMNLIANAIDVLEDVVRQQMKEGKPVQTGKIWISTQQVKDQVQIAIADNGTGMTEQVSSQIFDPFFTTKPIGQGTGLGLSISYQIVTEKHNGKMWCESTLGEGSKFVMEIPIHHPEATSA